MLQTYTIHKLSLKLLWNIQKNILGQQVSEFNIVGAVHKPLNKVVLHSFLDYLCDIYCVLLIFYREHARKRKNEFILTVSLFYVPETLHFVVVGGQSRKSKRNKECKKWSTPCCCRWSKSTILGSQQGTPMEAVVSIDDPVKKLYSFKTH